MWTQWCERQGFGKFLFLSWIRKGMAAGEGNRRID